MKKYLLSLLTTFVVGFLAPASTVGMVAIPLGAVVKRFRFALLVAGFTHVVLLVGLVYIHGFISIPIDSRRCEEVEVSHGGVDRESMIYQVYLYSKTTSSQIPALPADEMICNHDHYSVYVHYYLGRIATYTLLLMPTHALVYGVSLLISQSVERYRSRTGQVRQR